MSDALSKARAIAADAKDQRAVMGDAPREYYSPVGMFVGEHTGFVVMPDEMLTPLLDLAELWVRQLALGTTQGGGRQYDEHARQHTEARVLLARFYDLIGDDDE